MIAKSGLLTICEVRESTTSKNTRSEKTRKKLNAKCQKAQRNVFNWK